MKHIILSLSLVLIAGLVNAHEVVANKTYVEAQKMLKSDNFVASSRRESKESNLEFRVDSILANDGYNPSQMLLSIKPLGAKDNDALYFHLTNMIVEVTSVEFSDANADEVKIGYNRFNIDFDDPAKDGTVQENMTVKIMRDADGKLNGKIEIGYAEPQPVAAK